jgi:hypothetical protein
MLAGRDNHGPKHDESGNPIHSDTLTPRPPVVPGRDPSEQSRYQQGDQDRV